MDHAPTGLLPTLLVLAAAAAVASAGLGAPPARGQAPAALAKAEGADCVTYEGRAVYGALGYDHQVVLRNGCEKAAVCQVHTNVNPQPQEARLAPGAETIVVTYRGSPATAFTPTVRCETP